MANDMDLGYDIGYDDHPFLSGWVWSWWFNWGNGSRPVDERLY